MGVLAGIARRRIYEMLKKMDGEIQKKEESHAKEAYEKWRGKYASSTTWGDWRQVHEELVGPWNGDKFASAVALRPTGHRYGCGFSVNVDQVCQLNPYSFAKACEDAARTSGGWDNLGQRIMDVLKLPEPLSQVNSQGNVVAALIYDMVYGRGGKPKVLQHWLLDWLLETFGPSQPTVGGAAGFLANYFPQHLDERYVWLCSKYNSEQQAQLFAPETQRLELELIGGEWFWSTNSAHATGRVTDPTKVNVPIEWEEGLEMFLPSGLFAILKEKILKIKGQIKREEQKKLLTEFYDNLQEAKPFKLAGPNRTIFRAGFYLNPAGQYDPNITMEPTFYDTFGREWGIPSQRFDIYLKEIAEEFEGFLFSALHYLNDMDAGTRNQTKRELELLLNAKCAGHVEFSGSTQKLKWLEEVIRKWVPSIGINDDELKEVVRNLGLEVSMNPSWCETHKLYAYACALATYLEVQRLHVHTHVLDIVLRRR